MQFWRDIVASDINSYLKELQAALAGADPALVQDALFDAEEHLQAETAAGCAFAEVAEAYGSPEEVAAAYMDTTREQQRGPGSGPMAAPAVTAAATAPAAGPAATPTGPVLSAPGGGAGSAAAAPAAVVPSAAVPSAAVSAAAAPAEYPSVWGQIFGVFVDPQVYKSLLYMLIALATGTFYFTVVVTMLSTSLGMSVLIVGLPLLLLTLGFVRGMALFEGRVVELFLGTRMPRRPRAEFPGSFFQRLWFWLRDGRTWASMVYLVLMLPIGVFYFTFAVTGLAVGVAMIVWPFVQLITGHTWLNYGFDGAQEWLLPAWAMVLFVIAGFLVLLGCLHAYRWIGRGHAVFAKAMLVRLAK
jgi:Putative sensor/HAAS